MSDALVVLVTAPPDQAEALARTLVEEELCACVNLVPGVRSFYRWQGHLHDDAETLCVVKTTRAGLAALQARVIELHPYEVPEVVALPIEAGSGAYLDWIGANVKAPR